jgi:PAS domain S-box-containing protein
MGFSLKTVLHISGILVTVMLLSWCVLNTSYYATMLTLTLVLVFQIHALLRFVTNTNRQLSRFLDAVKHSDFSLSFRHRDMQGSFAALGQSIDNVLDRFREERSAKEAQATFLRAFVEQVPIAVLAIDEDGRIDVSNKALRKLTGRTEIRHLQQIADFDSSLAAIMTALKAGEEQSLKLKSGNKFIHLKVSCSVLRLKGKTIRLISVQDIGDELEAAELNAWQNLIRVMTHEIMNSITPITSLAETSNQYLKEVETGLGKSGKDNEEIMKALLVDAENALDTIGKRSQGLMRFVESYRTLTRLPQPEFTTFLVNELLKSVTSLMAEQTGRGNAKISIDCNPVTLALNADRAMLEQALINLVLNALDAVKEAGQPAITLNARLKERGGVIIEVTDNGTGITEDILENIFIPFFTTKRGGSGIGMSIVRQIVRLNGGQISVASEPGKGTTITLAFG